MQRIYPSLLIICLLSLPGFSQNLVDSRRSSYFTQIYKINNQQADQLYHDIWEFNQSFLTNPYDFFPTDSVYKEKLPIGHYLFVHSKSGKLEVDLRSVNNLNIKLLDNNRDLIMIFYDSTGRELKNPDVNLEDTRIPFHSPTSSFRLAKSNKKGIVKVLHEGHQSFFEIGRRRNNGWFKRTGNNIISIFPINHIVSIPIYLKDVIVNPIRGRGIHPPGIFYRTKRLFVPDPKTGYIAFNKPEYKPGDTVRFKAFIMNRKGRRYHKEVQVNLSSYYRDNFRKKITTIKPFRKGAYQYHFVLSDSLKLKLDNNYNIELSAERQVLISADFRYEDYELKNNRFEVRSENKPGRPAVLYLKGTDSNDMSLYDVRVEVLLQPSEIHKYYERTVFVPDTLWYHETKLENIGETKIILPDSLFPNVSMSYRALVDFMNSDNERISKTVNLSFDKEPFPIEFELKGDSLFISSIVKTPLKESVILESYDGNTLINTTNIQLPYYEKLNTFASRYQVRYMERSLSLELESKGDLLEIFSNRTVDSLIVQTTNPRKINFRYFLFRNQKLILSGETERLSLNRKCGVNENYFLSIQYVWGGRPQTQEYQIPFEKKILNIETSHAELVYPGEKAMFTISVHDAFNKPVAGADLTAYAITKKFKNQSAPSVPDLSRPTKSRIVINNFDLQDDLQDNLTRSLDFNSWTKTLGLDSLEFYKFLFPDSGYYENRIPAATSQFAPFIVGFGDVHATLIIYVDNQPVYYKGVSTFEPYSFHVRGGVHKIEIRINNALITIPKIYIEPSQKLIFSVDRFKLPAGCRIKEMPYQLTSEELNRLSRYFISVLPDGNNSKAFIRQSDRYYLLNNPTRAFRNRNLTGPLYPGMLDYVQKDAFNLLVDYEPFYHYEFRPGVLKMKSLDTRQLLKENFGAQWYDEPSFKDKVHTREGIELFWKNMDGKKSFKKFPDFKPISKINGRLRLDFKGRHEINSAIKATFILNLDNPDEYYVHPGIISNEKFNPGHYQALLIFENGVYLKADSIYIKQNGLNFYDFTGFATIQSDSLITSILKMIEKWSVSDSYYLRGREIEMQNVRTLYYEQSSSYNPYTFEVNGRITDQTDGSAIPGINIVIKGTAIGTVSDANGNYSINCPPDGILVFSFIGYSTSEIAIRNRENHNVAMNPDVQSLSEVVVVGYGTQTKHNIMAGVASHSLSGRVAGVTTGRRPIGVADSVSIRIRGISSVLGNDEPLVILDGVVVKISDVNPDKITAYEILKSEQAVAIYGSRAANGVVLLSTRPNADKQYLKQMSKSFMPVPIPDENVGTSLRKNFRDYAFWKPDLITDENGKAVFDVVFPDDITGWNLYVSGVGSKRRTGQSVSRVHSYKPLMAQIAQPAFLIETDSATGIGKITNYSQERLHLLRGIKINGQNLDMTEIEIESSHIDSISLAPSTPDSMNVEYSVTYKKYKDGEQRKIPVYKRGTLESNGYFLSLSADTSMNLSFNKENQQVKLYARADLLDVLLDEIKYLKNYPYECNEQLASKLRALVIEQKIRKHRNEPVNNTKAIEKIIKKLISNQKSDGGWSWWKSGESELWVSLHVAKGLVFAEKAGFLSPFNKEEFYNYLESEMNSSGTAALQLEVWNFLSEQGQTLKIKSVIDTIKNSSRSTLYEKLLAESIQQNLGEKPDWHWINSLRSQTLMGNYYWRSTKNKVCDNDIINTLLVYRIGFKDNMAFDQLIKIQNFFLEQRKYNWRNTYESALILEALLPGILKQKGNAKPELNIIGTQNIVINRFPFETTLSPGDFTLTKSGNDPVYFTAYQESWNPNPHEKDDIFSISTSFENGSKNLKAGKPVQLKIKVEVKADAEYVMIEVPVPAGCSYSSKHQGLSNNEVHREYYNHKTNIYCKFLKKGVYDYTIELLPRYNGSYTLNPAVVESMYFPVLYGRNKIERINIK